MYNDPEKIENMLSIYNNVLAFGLLDESEPISLMFKLILIEDLWILLLLQICVAVRTIIFDGNYSEACALYVLLDWLKGVGLSLFVFTSPFSLIYFFRAFRDAFTAYFTEQPDK